jgi:spore germination cell wall hydrolase CwlJ-like protein
MPDGVNIDWSLAQPKDYLTPTINAFQLGRQIASQQGQSQAGQLYASNPTAGANAMMAYNPALGMQMSTAANAQADRSANIDAATALASGDTTGAQAAAARTGDVNAVTNIQQHVAQLSETQLKVAQTRAQIVGGVLNSVMHSTSDPAQRVSILQHIASQNPQYGINPNSITPDMVSDAGISAYIGQTMSAQQQIEDELKAREADETHRHNVADEGKPQYVETKGADSSTTQTLVNPGAVSAAAGQGAPAAGGGPIQATPADLDAMARMSIGEAEGEGAGGQAAVMHVALNRARATGQPIASLITAPGQFQGMASPRTQLAASDPRYQAAYHLAQGVAGGQIADPTGGATNFINPALQAQQGQPMPAWAQGPGQRIGNHVFYGGGASAAGQGGAAPGAYQVASNGPTTPPPSAGSGQAVASGQPSAAAAPTIAGTPTQIGSPANGAAPGDPTKTGADYLATLDPTTRSEVNAILDGRMVVPSGAALRSPQIARLVAAAAQADPAFDQANAGARAKTRADFAAGKAAQNVVSLNTALGHMGELDQAIDQLHNGSFTPANMIGNAFSQTMGEPTVSRFNAAKTAVADELTRVFRGGPGSEADVKGWLSQLDASKSPAQLHAVVRQMSDLLASRVDALGDQYAQGMGVTRDGMTLLHPDAAATLARLGGQNAQMAKEKATFYQNAEATGTPARDIDGRWQQYAKAHAGRFGEQQAPAGAPAGQGGWKVVGVQQ